MIISATTFQLTHADPYIAKFSFHLGDIVNSPLGKGKIVILDEATGRCNIKLIKKKKNEKARIS